MARQSPPASPPLMKISIATAIKAGFFGAIGFFVAQLVLVLVTIAVVLLCGVSLAGIGLATGKVAGAATSSETAAPARLSK